jgi:TIR domain-containing protein
MRTDPVECYDFFLSRRGSVAAVAREVADVLVEKGYRVFVQDYDIPFASSLVEKMHEAVSNSRDLLSCSHTTIYSHLTLARSSPVLRLSD